MKVVGFYIVDRNTVSPTVFRSIACDKLFKLGFDLKSFVKPGVKERSDIIIIKDNGESLERAKEFLVSGELNNIEEKL